MFEFLLRDASSEEYRKNVFFLIIYILFKYQIFDEKERMSPQSIEN